MSKGMCRAKRTDNGEWVESSHAKEKDGKIFLFCTTAKGSWLTLSWVQVERGTICSYSGREDANGKKIFELDILSSRSKPKWHGIMQWVHEIGDYQVYVIVPEGEEVPGNHEGTLDDWEIIGNLYDNPELLDAEVIINGKQG